MEEREREKNGTKRKENPFLACGESPLGPASGPLPQENPQVQEPCKINH
jgi:hypothetical protein